jgi:predicted kinase
MRSLETRRVRSAIAGVTRSVAGLAARGHTVLRSAVADPTGTIPSPQAAMTVWPVTDGLRSRPAASGPVVEPREALDLRGHLVTQLRYPRHSIVVLAGIPGSGKSTLLHRLFGTTGTETQPVHHATGVLVLDSEQARNHLRRRLHHLYYPLWRPLAHLLQYTRIVRALRSGAPVVVHDCGTRYWVPRLLRRWSARHHMELHLILLEVAPALARAAQLQRNRLVRATAFAAHCRRWQHRTATGPAGLIPGAASAVILDRATADRLQDIQLHTGPPSPPFGGP